MTVIRVVPSSVQGYGREAQGIFGEMHTSLKSLVTDVVAVRYFGENAFAFKTEAGRVAADFAAKLYADLGAMTGAVKASTSNIAGSLGGAPIAIALEPLAITPPVPAKVDYVDVDTSALEQLRPVVNRHFASLQENLDRHLAALRATDWEGNAKIAAVDQVAGFTQSAKAKCVAAETSISNYISSQLDSVVRADV